MLTAEIASNLLIFMDRVEAKGIKENIAYGQAVHALNEIVEEAKNKTKEPSKPPVKKRTVSTKRTRGTK